MADKGDCIGQYRCQASLVHNSFFNNRLWWWWLVLQLCLPCESGESHFLSYLEGLCHFYLPRGHKRQSDQSSNIHGPTLVSEYTWVRLGEGVKRVYKVGCFLRRMRIPVGHLEHALQKHLEILRDDSTADQFLPPPGPLHSRPRHGGPGSRPRWQLQNIRIHSPRQRDFPRRNRPPAQLTILLRRQRHNWGHLPR